jgi:hypothetical protein
MKVWVAFEIRAPTGMSRALRNATVRPSVVLKR